MTTFKYRWIKWLCHPGCICGWEGLAVQNLKQAKNQHGLHVREDCPIGSRKVT